MESVKGEGAQEHPVRGPRQDTTSQPRCGLGACGERRVESRGLGRVERRRSVSCPCGDVRPEEGGGEDLSRRAACGRHGCGGWNR